MPDESLALFSEEPRFIVTPDARIAALPMPPMVWPRVSVWRFAWSLVARLVELVRGRS